MLGNIVAKNAHIRLFDTLALAGSIHDQAKMCEEHLPDWN